MLSDAGDFGAQRECRERCCGRGAEPVIFINLERVYSIACGRVQDLETQEDAQRAAAVSDDDDMDDDEGEQRPLRGSAPGQAKRGGDYLSERLLNE